jgi:hypothetical protein
MSRIQAIYPNITTFYLWMTMEGLGKEIFRQLKRKAGDGGFRALITQAAQVTR